MFNKCYRLVRPRNFNLLPGKAIMPLMETIKTALFEDPFFIYVILAVAAAAGPASGGRP